MLGLYFIGAALGLAVSALWPSWWNMTLLLPGLFLLWWLRRQQRI
jgi:hypothetical protein